MTLKEKPTIEQLGEIKLWLIEEDKIMGQGFFCNWATIEKSFYNNSLLIFEFEKKIIGFLSWTNFDSYVEIDLMEVHPNYRSKNIGNKFYKKVENYFQSKGYKAIKLFCSPEESEKFWKKMDFIKFPNRGFAESELTYYKPLIKVNELITDDCDNKLELWNVEPYEIKEQKANWTWDVKKGHNPILQPCNPNWNLRLSHRGKIIKDYKVKYFSKDKEIYHGYFLLIESF